MVIPMWHSSVYASAILYSVSVYMLCLSHCSPQNVVIITLVIRMSVNYNNIDSPAKIQTGYLCIGI